MKDTNTIVTQEMINKESKADYITLWELSEKVGTMISCGEMEQRYRNIINQSYPGCTYITKRSL